MLVSAGVVIVSNVVINVASVADGTTRLSLEVGGWWRIIDVLPVRWLDQGEWSSKRRTRPHKTDQIFVHSMSQLDRLPMEIKLKIFMETDVRTLEMSRSVCRDWNRIITDSASLQHKIELAVSGVGQAPAQTAGALQLEDRPAMLRAHRAAWRNPVWHEFRTSLAAQVGTRIFSEVSFLRENVFAVKVWTDPNIYLTRIPSRRLGTTEWESWTVNLKEDMGRSYFTMDPSQDLLVLMEAFARSTGCGTTEVSVHLRSLETGATHPLARSNILYVSLDPSPRSALSCEGQIVGDRVGVLYSSGKTPGFKETVVVWNWKTGDKILEIASTSFFSFTFIDEIHVLIASHYHYIEEEVWDDSNTCAAVWVYDLTHHTSSRTNLTDGTYSCAFFLPPSFWVDSIYVCCNPNSLRQSLLSYSSVEDLPDSIIRIYEHCHADEGFQLPEVYDEDDGAEAVVQIFVPASRLRARISGATPGQRFSWHEWGPTDAYVEVDTRPDEPITRLDTVLGMRAVSPAADFDRLYIYDFESLRISRYLRAGARVSTRPKSNAARNGIPPPRSVTARISLSWDENAERMFPRGFEGREHDSSKELRGLKTVVKLPEELWGLEWESYDSLITDDAVVILNVRRPESIHILRL